MLAETVAEVGAAAKTAVGGNLHDGLVGPFQKQLGGIIQTQLQDVGAHLAMFAAFGEDAAYAFLRQVESLHDGIPPEFGITEEMFADDDVVDILIQLLVGH